MGEVLGGRYELLDVIGAGGMGTVWRARDLRSGDVVAAKVMRQSDAGSLLRFVRETGFRIHHPHVLVPLGWVGEDDRVVLAMPLVDGGSVATLIGDYGALPPLLVAELLRQTLGALDAVHAAGVVHRDLKPANLLLRATGGARPELVLSDFGIALELNSPRLTTASFVVGTPGYLAPEQLAGSDPDPRQDLFAVGMVAREMLTGVRPRVVAGYLPPVTGTQPTGVPDALWALVADLSAVDPAERPTCAAEALQRLADPALAWTDTAMDDIEVLVQLPDAGAPGAGAPGAGATGGSTRAAAPSLATAPGSAPTPLPEPSPEPAPHPSPMPPTGRGMPPAPPADATVRVEPTPTRRDPRAADAPDLTVPVRPDATRVEAQVPPAARRTPAPVAAPRTTPDRPQVPARPSSPPAPAQTQSPARPQGPTPAPAQPQPARPVLAETPAARRKDGGPAQRPPAPLNGAVPLILAALFLLGLLIALVAWHPWASSAAPWPGTAPVAPGLVRALAPVSGA